MKFVENIKLSAKTLNNNIVLPEGTEERTLRAADQAIAEGLARITLLGSPETIKKMAQEMGLNHISKAEIIDPLSHPKMETYVNLMLKLRGDKGLTREEAEKLIRNPLYLGVMMIKNGDADGEVAGAENSTGDVLRPAFQYVKTAPGYSVVSGAFFMVLPDPKWGSDGVIVFADGAVYPDPNEKELAEIAVATGHTARAIGNFEPRVAIVSFSTKGSAKHPMVDKIINATRLAKEMAPDMLIDGELQVDAALVEAIGAKKAPGSPIEGKANVLIFPNLETGNIAYKLVQRLAGAEAIGPVLQGMAAPINDLSRGCSVNDIVSMIAITANQAGKKN